ncbi:MAG TPA: aminoglycoside phosphotransferase family protein [Candidatus Saccharimonadales bacterium]|nr:aminoglycoside phosphotransferase family protein [Candidatus Saccharimonadales bacterium]
MSYTQETLLALCRQGNLVVNADDISPMRAGGIANSLYNIADKYVLRISVDNPEALSDVLTESVAAPVAYEAGIRSPRLMYFDDSKNIINTPYTIYELVPGKSLAKYGKTITENSQIYYAVGAELAKLHTLVKDCPDPRNYLDHQRYADGRELIQEMFDRGYIGNFAREWLRERFDRLEPAMRTRGHKRAFLHGDNHTGNIMVHDGKFAAFIDWGDACWGDPASDFMYLPTRAIPATLEGYRSHAKADEIMELRILYYHLTGALYRLKSKPAQQLEDWAITPGSRLFELLAAATSHMLDSWKKVLA